MERLNYNQEGSVYVYFVECPIDNSIKFINVGRDINIPPVIRKSQHYKSWKKKLQKKKLKPSIVIIDDIKIEEVDFWLEFYKDLLKSWNIQIFESIIEEKMNVLKKARENLLYKYLSCGPEINGLESKSLNVSSLINLTDILLKNVNKSRLLDEFCLMLVYTFYYGGFLSKICQYTFDDLLLFIESRKLDAPILRHRNLENSMWNYHNRYSKNKSKSNSEGPVFKEIYNSKLFEVRLNSLLKYYFHYDQNLKYKDHILFSKLFHFKKHDSIFIRKRLVSLLNIEEKYIFYHLIHSSRAKYILIDNSLSLKSILG